MVDMDKIYIHIIGATNNFSIVSQYDHHFSAIVAFKYACCVR